MSFTTLSTYWGIKQNTQSNKKSPKETKKKKPPKPPHPQAASSSCICKKRDVRTLVFHLRPVTLYLDFVSLFCLPAYAHWPSWYLQRCHLHLLSVFALPDLVSWCLLISSWLSSSPDLFLLHTGSCFAAFEHKWPQLYSFFQVKSYNGSLAGSEISPTSLSGGLTSVQVRFSYLLGRLRAVFCSTVELLFLWLPSSATEHLGRCHMPFLVCGFAYNTFVSIIKSVTNYILPFSLPLRICCSYYPVLLCGTQCLGPCASSPLEH